MISFPLVSYVLIAALRDRLLITLLLMIALGSSAALFLGSASVTEQQSFAVVFTAGGLRFLGVIGIILFICFYIRRAFDHKEVEFMLSRPISRVNYLISHMVSFSILSIAIATFITLAVAIIGSLPFSSAALWGGSLIVEYIIIASVALFFSMVLSSAASSALACIGFYVLARMVGTLLGITDITPETTTMLVLGESMKLISIIIPRLDLMAQTSWLIYGTADLSMTDFSSSMTETAISIMKHIGLIGFVIIQGIVFVALLLTSSVFDLVRKQF